MWEIETAQNQAAIDAQATRQSGNYQMPIDSYGSNIQQLTNPQIILDNIESTLRSQIRSETGSVIQIGQPLLNEIGIKSIMGQIQGIVNQVTIMSNLEDIDIEGLRNYMADSLAQNLMINNKRYEIRNRSDRTKIYSIAICAVHICMKRPYKNGERGFWGKATSEIRHIMDGAKQKSGGGIQGMLGWR